MPSCRHSSSASSDRDFADSESRVLQVVYALIVAQVSQLWGPIPRLHLVANNTRTPVMVYLSCQSQPQSAQSQLPSLLSLFSNTVQLVSTYPLQDGTHFAIYKGRQLVDRQVACLRQGVTPNEFFRGFIYECDLASSLWVVVSKSNGVFLASCGRIVVFTSSTQAPIKSLSCSP
jgi:hypothetical protein